MAPDEAEAVSAKSEATMAYVPSQSGGFQKPKLLSPLRPHTTMAIENVKMAAREAQPRVISIGSDGCGLAHVT
jgi:hypothetical protein